MHTADRPRIQVETLKREHPLADVLLASGLELRSAGSGTFKARCPFHDDRTPSLFVDTRDDHFHCFSCGVHGDAINFLMRRDGVGFGEACARLGSMRSQPVVTITPWQRPGRSRSWSRMTVEEQTVMNAAATLWQETLWRTPSALTYLHKRGIPNWVIGACGIGYCDGRSLEACLGRIGGLAVAQHLGLFDEPLPTSADRPRREVFAGRLVIPELRAGNAVWFIARALDDTRKPKYLAIGGDRPVLGSERTAFQRDVVLVEGVLDYLTAVSWDLPACSPCGTQLPADRLGFLAQAKTVFGVLDGDAAGRTAAERFHEQLGERWRSIQLPDGLDLNDLAQHPGGRATFFALLAAARRNARKEQHHGA